MPLCIPKELAVKLKQAAADGKIDIAKMYELSSRDRRQMFKDMGVKRKLAKEINVEFEKAMISEKQDAMLKWAEDVFTGSEKKTIRYKDVITKINDLKELGLLTPKGEDAFLQDLVAARLGASVTSEEAGRIVKLSEKMETLASDKSEFGTPTIEYFKAMREMENYLDSISPSSNLRVLTETIGRGTMLASFKSPIVNIESNTVNGVLQAAERRLSTGQFGGVNGEYAINYIKFVNKLYKETGYDVSRMEYLTTGRRQLGEDVANTQGKGPVKALGRVYQDVVFNKLMTAPDVAFSSVHAADAMNLLSTKMAKSKGFKGEELQAKALEYFKDATSLEPQTPEGSAIKQAAIIDAKVATYTNDSTYADVSLGIRKLFNIATGDLRVGDQIMPFVKTPANVIGAGIEASGLGLPPEVLLRTIRAISDIREGSSVKDAFGENYTGFFRKVVRAGLGVTSAYLISLAIKPDDFMGEFPTSQKEQELMRLKNAPTNSIRVNGKWISLDYFGPLAAPLVGFLYAKKYGNNLPTAIQRYVQGAGRQVTKVPGFEQAYDTYKAISDNRPDKASKEGEITNYVINMAVDYLRSRFIPALVSDYAKATDEVERKVDYKKPLDKLKSNLPGKYGRESLPEKTNTFGETMQSEGWNTILFGARVKTAQDSKLIRELERLDQTGNLPSITDVSKTSDRAKALKEQVGDEKFDEAMRFYGSNFKEYLEKIINNPRYEEITDDKKKDYIDKIKNKVFEMTLIKYNYKKPKK